MADRFRVGSGPWNTTASWSSSSGGLPGLSVPGASDKAIFDGGGTNSMVIDLAFTIAELSILSAYTGTFDNATNDHNLAVTGDVTMAGTRVDMGDGDWTVGGNFDNSGVTTWNRNNSTVIMTGTAKTINIGGAGGNDLHKLTIATGATISIVDGTTCRNVCIINGILTVNVSDIFGFSGGSADLQVSATGKITDDGGLTFKNETSLSVQLGTIDIATMNIQNNHTGSSEITPGTYDSATVNIVNTTSSTRTFTFGSGTYTFTGNVDFNTTSTGGFTIDAATNDPVINIDGNLGASDGGGNITLNMGDGTWTLKDDVDFTDITTFTKDGSSIILGAGDSTTHLIDFSSFAIGPLTMNASGDTKQIQSNFTTESLTTTAGTLDDNGKNISVAGNISLAAGTYRTSGTLTHTATSGTPIITTNGNSLTNLTVDNSGVDSFLAQDDIVLTGSLNVMAGSKLDMNGFDLTISGSFTNSTGTDFKMSGGTLKIDGSADASFTGDSTIDKLQLISTTDKKITWKDGDTFTFPTDLDLQAGNGKLLTMVSSVPGVGYNFVVNGTHTVRNVDVKDSDATAGSTITAIASIDRGNNLNWIFDGEIFENILDVRIARRIYPVIDG